MSEEGDNRRQQSNVAAYFRHAAMSVLRRLLYAHCESDSLSEKGLREIIERRGYGLIPNNPNINDYEFFFEACRNERVTEGIIRYLLKYFPAAANATDDNNGWSPLHTACHNKNATLNIVQLLIDAAPNSIQSPDKSGALPLHVACQHHESASVVQYLLSHGEVTIDAVDRKGNTALHLSCRGAKYDTIALLLEEYDAVSVSTRNTRKKLPIEILWESNKVLDRESIGYTESIFRLLRAYPETIMNIDVQKQQRPRSGRRNGMPTRSLPLLFS